MEITDLAWDMLAKLPLVCGLFLLIPGAFLALNAFIAWRAPWSAKGLLLLAAANEIRGLVMAGAAARFLAHTWGVRLPF